MIDTRVEDTSLDQCVLQQTVIAGVDLSWISGLESCRHDGPSHVAGALEPTATGLRDRPERQTAVETFLQGAGVPSEYLRTFRETVRRPIEYRSCFISYSHTDAEFARRLHDDLQTAGVRCWIDEHSLSAGENIYAAVDRGIRSGERILLCCSRASLGSWWVDREIVTALERERELHQERGHHTHLIIPIDLDGYFLDGWKGSHAAELRQRKAVRFVDWQNTPGLYQRELGRLVDSLRSDDQASEHQAGAAYTRDR